jgi:hypothetical protein
MKVIPYQVQPSPKQYQLAAIDNFGGGVQLSKPETGLATDEFRQLVNWYIDDQGYLTLRPGYRPAQGEDVKMSNPGISMFCTDVSPGNIIAATQNGNNVDVSYWTGTAWNVIHQYESSSDVIQYLEYAVNEQKDVFFFDGTGVPKRWSLTSKTVTITGGTKGSNTTYTCADTEGLAVGMTVTISIDQSPEYNSSTQKIISIVTDTSFVTDLDSSSFTDNPGAGSEPIIGGTKGVTTLYTVASTTGIENGLSITCAGDAEAGYNVAQTVQSFVLNTSITTDLDSSLFATDPDGNGTFSWTGTGTVVYYPAYDLGLTKPTAVPTGAAGTPTVGFPIEVKGDFYYKYTWFYDNGTQYGESNASPVSAAVAVAGQPGTGDKVTVTLPAMPTNVTKTRIYRSRLDEAQGPFYYLGEIRTGTTYTDSTPEREAGVQLPVDDGNVPNLKEAVVTAGRIVGIDGDIEEKIVWSEPGYPDLFPALNFFYLQEKAIGLVVFNRTTYILSESAVYAVPNSDFASQVPVKVSEKGCISSRTVKNVTTGICWLSNDNAYWANFNVSAEDGDYAIPIGTPLQDEITSMNPNAWSTATGGFFNEKYYLTLPAWGSAGAYSVWCWNMRPAMRMLKQGRWGGWTSMGWYASDIQGFEDILYTLDPVKKSDGYYYIYTHDASGASGVLNDYPEYAAGDYTASAVPVGCVIETGLTLLPIDVYETVLYRTTIITETTGGTFTITAKLNKKADATAEYTRVLTVSLGDGYAQGAATNWFTWVQVGDDPNGLWPMVAVTDGSSAAVDNMVYTVDATRDEGVHGLAVNDTITVLPVAADGTVVDAGYTVNQTVTAKTDTTITTNLQAATGGLGACPDGARIVFPTPIWPALRQVHGKGTKRWPKGTKGNLVQLNFQGKGMGETKINRIITYYKIITRAI